MTILTMILVVVAAAFWAALPVKLIALAGLVYTVIQVLKEIVPSVTGWKALALNIVLSAAGALAIATPGELQTPAFWAGLLMTVASASGIHGTVQAFKPVAPPS